MKASESGHATAETSFASAHGVVCALHPFQRYAYTYAGELPGQVDDTVGKPSGGGDDNAWCMTVAFLHNLGQIFPHKWLAPGDVDEFQTGKGAEVGGLDLTRCVGGISPDITHVATHRTAIGHYHRGVARHRSIFFRSLAHSFREKLWVLNGCAPRSMTQI